VRGAARQDEEKLGERARGMAMHYEATAKSGANARVLLPSTSGSPRPPLLLLRESDSFVRLRRDTGISYFVQVPFSHLLFTESKKEGDSCSFHYGGRNEIRRRIPSLSSSLLSSLSAASLAHYQPLRLGRVNRADRRNESGRTLAR
jgi:hypothetical protein